MLSDDENFNPTTFSLLKDHPTDLLVSPVDKQVAQEDVPSNRTEDRNLLREYLCGA